ncbi:MAG TPA: DsrE family protein [Candidatus Bathyarchaeia archaeon]
MDSIAFLITSLPYGKEDAFRGVYLPFATVSKGVKTFVLLVGDGVCSALKNQQAKTIEYPDVSQLIQNILALGGQVFASRHSCEEMGIKEDDLINGVISASDEHITQTLIQADGSIVF